MNVEAHNSLVPAIPHPRHRAVALHVGNVTCTYRLYCVEVEVAKGHTAPLQTLKLLRNIEINKKEIKMKKCIWAIAAVIMVVGTITIVACTKDNPTNEMLVTSPSQHKNTKMDGEIIIAEWSDNGISYRFDKHHVLSNIQTQFKDSLNVNCVMEDIQITIKDVDNEKVPIIAISYFDFDNEVAVTMFGILTQYAEKSPSVMLALKCREISARCIGVNCKEGCNPIVGKTMSGGTLVLDCSNCTKASNPNKSYKCDYNVTQRLVSRLVFDSFLMDLF